MPLAAPVQDKTGAHHVYLTVQEMSFVAKEPHQILLPTLRQSETPARIGLSSQGRRQNEAWLPVLAKSRLCKYRLLGLTANCFAFQCHD